MPSRITRSRTGAVVIPAGQRPWLRGPRAPCLRLGWAATKTDQARRNSRAAPGCGQPLPRMVEALKKRGSLQRSPADGPHHAGTQQPPGPSPANRAAGPRPSTWHALAQAHPAPQPSQQPASLGIQAPAPHHCSGTPYGPRSAGPGPNHSPSGQRRSPSKRLTGTTKSTRSHKSSISQRGAGTPRSPRQRTALSRDRAAFGIAGGNSGRCSSRQQSKPAAWIQGTAHGNHASAPTPWLGGGRQRFVVERKVGVKHGFLPPQRSRHRSPGLRRARCSKRRAALSRAGKGAWTSGWSCTRISGQPPG